MRFSRQQYWSGSPFPFPGDRPHASYFSCSAKQVLYHCCRSNSLDVKVISWRWFFFLWFATCTLGWFPSLILLCWVVNLFEFINPKILKKLFNLLKNFSFLYRVHFSFSSGSDQKESACHAEGFHLWVGKIPCRRKWQPTPVCLPGEFHG